MIVLFTDFGLAGPYTGQMKAVIAARAPGISIIDLFADAPRFDPKRSAYLLAAYASGFAPGSVFLAVVDPGMGSERKPVVLKADGRIFVGPDNGLMEIVARRAKEVSWHEIRWRPPHLSASFHGRDLFAPVAAELAAGRAVDLVAAHPDPGFAAWPDDLAEIVYVDVFGNAMTGLRSAAVPPGAGLMAGRAKLSHARTFSEVATGAPFWYANAEGLVEIAVNGGRADSVLGLRIGDIVSIL